jgi:hypothetical protein
MERVYGAYQERGHTMRNVSPVEPVDRVDRVDRVDALLWMFRWRRL